MTQKGMLQKIISNIPTFSRHIVFPNRLCNKEYQVIRKLQEVWRGCEGPENRPVACFHRTTSRKAQKPQFLQV